MKARDVMTRQVVTVRPDTTLSAAATLMVEKQVSGLPVVANEGRIVGILTEGDLLQRIETGTLQKLPSRWIEFLAGPGCSAKQYVTEHSHLVADLMTKEVVTVTGAMPLDHVVEQLMLTCHIRRVPVVRFGRLIGIMTRRDLVRALARKLSELPTAPSGDAEIEATIKAELKSQPWVMANNISITVKDGVATLQGLVSDDRCRRALHVAAENVAGVREVLDDLVWTERETPRMFATL